MEIKSERIILREFNEEDKKIIVPLLNNLNVTKWLLVYPFPFDLSDAEKTINHMIKRSLENPRTSYNLAIELKKSKELIGGIGLVKIDLEQKTGGVMYWVGEKYWRNGYGSEALKIILDFAFNVLKLRRLYAEVYPGNDSSINLLEKFGFKKEGYLRKSVICKADGKIKDTLYYGLLKEDYNK
ncbi:MAG: GNAT family N-acetyltransferase [Nanoarchaeota archaeon]|nr:GNAT family N-acetyltransferase [Nanoarchaeota archaeon]